MGKNINLAVNAFDEHKAKLDSLNKNKLNKKKDEVISETIQAMVAYIENFMSLQEKLSPLINNFKFVKDTCQILKERNVPPSIDQLKKMMDQRSKYLTKTLYVSMYDQLMVSHQLDKQYSEVYF